MHALYLRLSSSRNNRLLLIVAISLVTALLLVDVLFSPDSFYYIRIWKGEVASENFRVAYLALGKFLYLIFPNAEIAALVFHILQYTLSLALIGIFAEKFFQNFVFVTVTILVSAVWINHTAFYKFGIDSFVFTLSIIMIFVCHWYASLEAKEHKLFNNSTVLFALIMIFLAVLAALSKPLVIFVALGTFIYGLFCLCFYREAHSDRLRLIIITIVSLICILIMFFSMQFFATEREGIKFSNSVWVHLNKPSTWENPLLGLLSPFAKFELNYSQKLFGSGLILLTPFVCLTYIAYRFHQRKMYFFPMLFIGQIAMMYILGVNGLRPTQAVTLLATWVMANVALVGFVFCMFQNRIKPHTTLLAVVLGISAVGVAVGVRVYKLEHIKFLSFVDGEINKNFDFISAKLEDENSRVFYHILVNQEFEFLKNELDVDKQKRVLRYDTYHSVRLLEGGVKIRPKKGDLIFHRWQNRKAVGRYKNLLYVRDKVPRMKLLKFNVCYPKGRIKPVRKGDYFLVPNRWRKLFLPYLSLFSTFEETDPGYYEILSADCSKLNDAYIHESVTKTMAINPEFDYGIFSKALDNKTILEYSKYKSDFYRLPIQ